MLSQVYTLIADVKLLLGDTKQYLTFIQHMSRLQTEYAVFHTVFMRAAYVNTTANSHVKCDKVTC